MEVGDPMDRVFEGGAALNIAGAQVLAERMAKDLRAGDWLFLEGDLGAGKTSFVSMLVAAAFSERRDGADSVSDPKHSHAFVSSPTFALCHEYQRREGDDDAAFSRLVHMDLYRIKHDDEVLYLGLDEMILSDSVVVLEWGERVSDAAWKSLWSGLPNGEPKRKILLQIDHSTPRDSGQGLSTCNETRWYRCCYR
jgi:tRNA A37 threonylcarbamoyladenosine biosynthesis protein TsaE